MKISSSIRKRLKTDLDFRLQTARALGVTEGQIRRLAGDKSDNNNLTKIAAVNFFKSMQYSEEQIFEIPKHSKSA